MQIIDRVFNRAYENQRTFFLILSISISLFTIELSVSNVSDIINIANASGIFLFLGLSAVFAFLQYLILKYAYASTTRLRKFPRFPHVLHKVVTVFQCVLTALLTIVILQIIIFQFYYTFLLLLAVSISLGLSSLIFAILGWRFVKWYNSTYSFVVLLYAISCIVGVIGVVATTVFFDTLILADPVKRTASSEVIFKSFEPGTLEDKLQSVYSNTNIVYYLILWFATSLLIVRQNSKIDTIKQILLLIIPLASYLSIFLVVDKIIELYGSNTETIYVILFGYTLPNIVSGVLFGIPFWTASRSLDPNSSTRQNLILAGIGFVFFFVVTSAVVDQAPYPPVGMISICLVGLTTYLVFIGLYYSAISISENMTIRRHIKRTVKKELKLLDNISYGEISNSIRDKILKIARNKALELSEIENTEDQLSDQEIRNYTDEVIREVRKSKQ